jgi:hypothetical protein
LSHSKEVEQQHLRPVPENDEDDEDDDEVNNGDELDEVDRRQIPEMSLL